MRIKKRLQINIAVSISMALIVCLVLLLSLYRLDKANNLGIIAGAINTCALERLTLRSDYVQNNTTRAKEQWFASHEKLGGLLEAASETFRAAEDRANIAASIEVHKSIGIIFSAIVANKEKREASGPTALSREVEDRLLSQLNMRVYEAVLYGRNLLDSSRKARASALGLAGAGVISVLFIIIGAILFNTWTIGRTIADRLRRLYEGVAIIGRGSLDHWIDIKGDDEFAELSEAFNGMTAKLRVSYHELENEVGERRRAGEALLKSEQRWATTLASIGDAVIATDVTGRITFMNAVAEALTGWKLYDAMERPIGEVFRIINEQTREEVESPVVKVLKEKMIVGLANHTILIRKDGTEVPIDDSGAPIRDGDGGTTGVVLVFRDIAERRKAEEQIARQNYLQQLLLDHFPGVILLLRATTREVVASNQPGINVGAVSGSKCFETWGQNEDPCPCCLAQDLWTTGKEQQMVLDAGERVMEAHWVPVSDDLYMHYAFDVTERKRGEEKLAEKERMIQQALSISRSFTFEWDPSTDRVHRSDSCRKIFGVDGDEMCDDTFEGFSERLHPDDRARLHELLRSLTPARDTYTTDFRLLLTDGSVVMLGETGQAFFDAAGKTERVVGVAHDVTARTHAEEALRKAHDSLEIRVRERTAELSQAYDALRHEVGERERLEERLRQTQKMEAIGTLAGGIAHDFNNILAAILGFTEMAVDDTLDRPEVGRNLQNVLKSAMRARDLVKQILAFGRKSNHERTPLSLTPLIKETVQLLRASIPATIEIKLTHAASSDTILAAPVEVQQILMNLATNASLSMQEKGGILEISLTDIEFAPDSSFAPDLRPGEYLQLAVKDTGAGMSPEVTKRVFEPFFTTREVGQGTGMGLAVVYGIVKDLQGTITVESEPGAGSTFRVLLPKIQGETKEEKLHALRASGGRERILFVDDEEMLVLWAERVLSKLGYAVTTMAGSAEALEAFSSDPTRFDLVITDHTMPGMTGVQLSKELLMIRSDIPIILCTGHSETASPEIAKEAGIREYLMKPLTKQELAEAVRSVLDAWKEE